MQVVQNLIASGDRFCGMVLEGWSRIALQATVFVAGFLGLAAYSVRIGSQISFDFKNYHYYSAYALLNGRLDFDYAAASLQSFLNPVSFVPFYLMASHFKPTVAGFLMGGVHGLAVGLLFMIALTLFSAMSPLPRLSLALSCAALGVYGPAFMAMVGSSSNDNLIGLLVLASVYTLVRGITVHGAPDARRGRGTLLVGGVLMGVAVGLKLAFTVYLLGCAVAVFVTGRGWQARLSATGLLGVASVLGILLSRGFWMASMWSKFESPLFPFYNKIFRSPYYYEWNFADTRYLPTNFVDAFQLPFHFLTSSHFTLISGEFRDIRYALIYALVLVCIIVLVGRFTLELRRRFAVPSTNGTPGEEATEGLVRPSARASALLANTARASAFVAIFFIASYVIWQLKFAIIRYAVPLEFLAPIVIAVLIRLTVPRPYLRSLAVIGAFAAVAVIMRPCRFERQAWSKAYVHVGAPKFERPSRTLIVLANSQPYSYVIPFFQPEVRFVGLWSEFSRRTKPGERHRATEEMLALVRAHRGPVFVLSKHGFHLRAFSNLKSYDITQKAQACTPVPEGHGQHRRFGFCLYPAKVGNNPRTPVESQR